MAGWQGVRGNLPGQLEGGGVRERWRWLEVGSEVVIAAVDPKLGASVPHRAAGGWGEYPWCRKPLREGVCFRLWLESLSDLEDE